MPDIDQETFQWLVLAGLALLWLVGLAILAALGRIRKTIEGGLTAGAFLPPVQETPTSQEGTPAGIGTDEATDAPAALPADEMTVEEPEVAPAATATDEPENEAYQKDGRWWFRRDGELLVYDERAAEWQTVEGGPEAVAAPADTQAVPAQHDPGFQPSASASATSESPGMTEESFTVPDTLEGVVDAPVAEEDRHSSMFWKCPACGAVNGLTSTSCRMCFAAKP
jgi:ribosomal protein L40E